MRAIPFDTLEFKNTLLEANVPEEQADAQAKAMSKAFNTNLEEITTREDLNYLESRIDTKLSKLEVSIIDRIGRVQDKMDTQFKWLIGLMIGLLVTGLFKN